MDTAHRAQAVDALRMSLLSGMRLGEVLNLQVRDVDTEGFDIEAGRFKAARRRVPRHPGLAKVAARRTAGKALDALLPHELAGERDPEDPFGKRFARYGRRLGVGGDER